MQGNRRLVVLLGIMLVFALALGALFLWLSGGRTVVGGDNGPAVLGFTPVRSVYFYDATKAIIKPVGVGADSRGNFFVTLRDGHAVVEFNRNGDYVKHWGAKGMTPGSLLAPLGVAVDRLVDHVYVVDRSRLRVVCFNGDGKYLWERPVLNPTSVTVGDTGDVFVTTFGPIVRFSSEGELKSELGFRGNGFMQFDFPRQTAAAQNAVLYVADSNNARVQCVQYPTTTGETPTVTWTSGSPPVSSEAAKGVFTNPTGVAVSPRGFVVVLDGFQHIIRMLDPKNGEALTEFGGERRGRADGMFEFPTQIAHLSGDEYAITDTYNDRVQIVRLIEPGNLNPFRRFPWLIWLLPLLLLPLLWVFGRKRAFVTRDTLNRALEEGNGRLLIGVYRKLHVLPEVATEFADHREENVRIGDYLEPAEYVEPKPRGKKRDATPGPESVKIRVEDMDPEERLARAADRTLAQRLLLARHFVVCVDEEQCSEFEELDSRTMLYELVLEEYRIPERNRPDGAGAEEPAPKDS